MATDVFFSHHATADGDSTLLRQLADSLATQRKNLRTALQGSTVTASGALCAAVDRSLVVVGCLTPAYVDAVNGADALDLCSVAFAHAVQTKGKSYYLVPLVLDRTCWPPWTGTLGRAWEQGGSGPVDATLPPEERGWFRRRSAGRPDAAAARLVDAAGVELYVEVMGKLTRRRGMLFADNLRVHSTVFSSVPAADTAASPDAPHEAAALQAAANAVAAADTARDLPDEDKTSSTFVKDVLCGEVDAAGRAHGLSVCVFENGDSYAGEWATGRPSGLGVHGRAAWGHRYAGQWRNGVRAGCGVWSRPPPPTAAASAASAESAAPFSSPWRLYVGELDDDVFHGTGTLTYANGELYRGGFSRGRRHGRGTWWQSAGEVYTGEFVDDRCHGVGELRGPDGQVIYAGRFAQGQKAASSCTVA